MPKGPGKQQPSSQRGVKQVTIINPRQRETNSLNTSAPQMFDAGPNAYGGRTYVDRVKINDTREPADNTRVRKSK